MKRFHNITVKIYLQKSLNISKGFVRSQELSLCTNEERRSETRKQSVTEVKKVPIKKEGGIIETNTYIMTFDLSKIPEKIKIRFTKERFKQFIPNLLRCYYCQKYGHNEDNCRRRQVYRKCGQQDPEHHSGKCDYQYKCAHCGGNHPAYARSCESKRLEREITFHIMKHGKW